MRQQADGEHGGHHLIGGYDHFFVDVRDSHACSCNYPGYENLGTVRDPCAAQTDEGQACRKNYRERYRDPSEMIRLMMSLSTSPDLFYSEILHDGEFSKLWMEDFKYFRDCEFFDCSKPPDFRKLDFLYHQSGPSA
jgi:hypothetical protein